MNLKPRSDVLQHLVSSQNRMATSCDQHVLASLQDAAHRTARSEENTPGFCFFLLSSAVKRRFQAGTYFQAATDVMQARMEVLVTLPPKAPPILLT